MSVLAQLRVTLTLVARFLCSRMDVSVNFTHDNTASTDGRSINLPPIPRLELFSSPWSQLRARLLGYLVHEAGHILFTTFAARVPFATHPMKGFLLDMSNVLEDVRIERALMQRFRFGREYLHGLNIALVKEMQPGDPAEASAGDLLIDYVHHRLRAAVLRMPESQGCADHFGAEVAKRLKHGMIVKLNALADSVVGCRDTVAVVVLTEDIAAMIEAEAAQPEASDPNNGTQGQGSGSSQQGGQSPAASGASQQPQGQKGSGAGGSPHASPDPDLQKLLADLQQHAAGTAGGNGECAAVAINNAAKQAQAMGAEVTPLAQPSGRRVPSRTRAGAELLSSAKARSARIRQAMVSLMSNEYREARTYHEEGRRLAYNRLALVPVGERTIFVRQGRGLQQGATVDLEIDASSSMTGERFALARQAILALAAALDLVREARFMANAFGYSGTESTLIKDLDEPVWVAAERLAQMDGSGNTPMGEAVAFSTAKLLASTDRTKLMIVVTDGQPNCRDSLQQALADARAVGVVVAGIGMQSDAGADLFDHWITVDDISELPEKLVRLVTRQLRSSLHRAA